MVVIEAKSPQRNIVSTHSVFIATRGFTVAGPTPRSANINGESFEPTFNDTDPSGKPVLTGLKIDVVKKTTSTMGAGEKVVETHEVTSDAKNGEARQTLVLSEPGSYIVCAIGKDQFGNDVSNGWNVTISGDKDSTRLRILADRHSYNVGETAEVNLHWREKPALSLITL